MTRIRLLKSFGGKEAGETIKAYPHSAAKLIADGIAEEVKDGNIEDDSGSESGSIKPIGEYDTIQADERSDVSSDRNESPDSRSRTGRSGLK